MKILLIAIVAVCVGACYSDPVEYNAEFEAQRLANLQMTQKLAHESLEPLSTQEHSRNRPTSSQSNRNEYRIFGNDALSLNSERNVSSLYQNHETNGEAIHPNRNPEFQDASSVIKNQVNNFPSSSGIPIQRSSFYKQDLNSDLSYAYNPVPEVPFSSREIRPSVVGNRATTAKLNSQELLQKNTPRSSDHSTKIQTGVYSIQNIRKPSFDDRAFTTTHHSQEVDQRSIPFAVDHLSEIQTGVYGNSHVLGGIHDEVQAQRAGFQNQDVYKTNRDSIVDRLSQNRERTLNQNGKNIFESRSDAIQDQISQSQRAAFQNQGTFNASDTSVEDQNRRILNRQNGRSQLYDINQNRKHFTQIPHVSQQGQFKSSEEQPQYQHFSEQGPVRSSQEPGKQYQYLSQQGQIKLSQGPAHQRTSVPLSTLTKDSFDHISNAFESRRILGNRQPENQSKYASSFTQYTRDQQNDNLRTNENARIPSNFKDDSNRRDQIWNKKHDVETRTEDVAQGHFQTLSGQKTIFTAPQFRQVHVKTDLVSGSKGGPVVIHKTGSVPSSHAVIVGRDSGIPGKGASLTQHLKTPYTHYTYSHNL